MSILSRIFHGFVPVGWIENNKLKGLHDIWIFIEKDFFGCGRNFWRIQKNFKQICFDLTTGLIYMVIDCKTVMVQLYKATFKISSYTIESNRKKIERSRTRKPEEEALLFSMQTKNWFKYKKKYFFFSKRSMG